MQVTPAPLASGDINLIFVVSEDLSNNWSADGNQAMANLMGSYLRRAVLGNENVTEICALEPMPHLQTVNQFSDVAGNSASILTVSNGSGPTAT